jgi:glutathione peroxidase-family protein
MYLKILLHPCPQCEKQEPQSRCSVRSLLAMKFDYSSFRAKDFLSFEHFAGLSKFWPSGQPLAFV